MFNISLQINGDGEATEPQARAVIAALVNFYGPGIIPASFEQVGQVILRRQSVHSTCTMDSIQGHGAVK